MLREIERAIDPLASDPSIRMIVLYRIDGTPIVVKLRERNSKILSLLYWLENQIRDALYHIFNGDLDDLSFKFRDVIVRMYPVSRTLVLTIMAEEDVSLYKLDADVETVCDRIRDLI